MGVWWKKRGPVGMGRKWRSDGEEGRGSIAHDSGQTGTRTRAISRPCGHHRDRLQPSRTHAPPHLHDSHVATLSMFAPHKQAHTSSQTTTRSKPSCISRLARARFAESLHRKTPPKPHPSQQTTQLHLGALSSVPLGASAGLDTWVLIIRCIAVVSPSVTLQSFNRALSSTKRPRCRILSCPS